MNLIHDTELSLFTEVPEDKELNILYYLNQQNTPEVGELESINDLSKLIDMSAINFYVLAGDEIIGFVICFREGSEYKSPNYGGKMAFHFIYVISQQWLLFYISLLKKEIFLYLHFSLALQVEGCL